MSMLDRYRKTGGFFQLVSLVETCPPAKQEKFLEVIRGESPAWADAIKAKMLDIHKIYSWRDETLAEIFGTLQDLTVAVALVAADQAFRERIFKYTTHARRRKLEDLLATQKPTPAEVASTHFKIVETVRKMAHDGHLRFDKVAPELYFGDDIEDQLTKLLSYQTPAATPAATPAPTAAPVASGKADFKIEYDSSFAAPGDFQAPADTGPDRTEELLQLKRKVTDLSKENATLRHDLSVAKNKLDQIKKIA